MKFFLVLLLLSGLSFGGYLYYRQSRINTRPPSIQPESSGNLILTQSSDKLGKLATVLGESISNTYTNGKELLSNATGGASEPIINQLLTKTQETLKDLPKKEADKIKYEFCKGVVTEFESKQ